MPPEEAARKLASQNRLLRGKLRAMYRAEEENAKLRLQVEHLAEQLVRFFGILSTPNCREAHPLVPSRTSRADRPPPHAAGVRQLRAWSGRAAVQLMWTEMLMPMRRPSPPPDLAKPEECADRCCIRRTDILTGRAGQR